MGVLKAQVDLYEKGYFVCIPLTEHGSFDLVIVKDKERKTVQVKARNLKDGKFTINFRQVYSDSKGVHTLHWNKDDIDVVCVYCFDTDKCYYFDPKKYNRSLTLRVDTPKNNQLKYVQFVEDFLTVP